MANETTTVNYNLTTTAGSNLTETTTFVAITPAEDRDAFLEFFSYIIWAEYIIPGLGAIIAVLLLLCCGYCGFKCYNKRQKKSK